MHPIIRSIAARQWLETLLEVFVPVLGAAAITGWVVHQLITPSAGRPLSTVQALLILAGPAVLWGWVIGRLAFLLGIRRPRKIVYLTFVAAALLLFLLQRGIPWGFESRCEGLQGLLRSDGGPLSSTREVTSHHNGTTDAPNLCLLPGAEPENPIRPGVFLRLPWGKLGSYGWLWGPVLALLSGLSALGTYDRRQQRTWIPILIWKRLRRLPAAGSASALLLSGTSQEEGGVFPQYQACANLTLWGETCGQLYIGAGPARGFACIRCDQRYHASRMITLEVVSLVSGDQEELNLWELEDVANYPAFYPPRPPGPSWGRRPHPRWVSLGRLHLPEVLTTIQALALIFEVLPRWHEGASSRKAQALELAEARGSRLAAWLWPPLPNAAWRTEDSVAAQEGHATRVLDRARPLQTMQLLVGSARLRDVLAGGSSKATLQLDIGLMPVELCKGTLKKDRSEEGELQNLVDKKRVNKDVREHLEVLFSHRQIIWMPVAGEAIHNREGGRWVPRVEGAGLRRWVDLRRDRDSQNAWFFWRTCPWRGAIKSKSYRPKEPTGTAKRLLGGRSSIWTDPALFREQETLLVLLPWVEGPLPTDHWFGCDLAQWDWLEAAQVERLRSGYVVVAPPMDLWKSGDDRANESEAASTK